MSSFLLTIARKMLNYMQGETNEMETKIYIIKNLITGEIYGKVSTYTLAAAQEYFDIMFPYASNYAMLFELK